MYIKTLRPAIAMIELIFAIVVMGIVMMSAPMLVSTATQSSYVAIQQEGINEAASRVNMIMSYAWDENDTNGSYVPPILNTTSATADLQEVILNAGGGIFVRTGRRVGTPLKSQRTYFLSDSNTPALSASALGTDGVGEIEDDIDDFGGTNLSQIDAGAINYVETTTIDINTTVAYTIDNVTTGTYSQSTITYVPFTASATSTSNIKSITVTLTSSSGVADLNKSIVLRAFSCNVGGYEFKERVFQ